MKGNYKIGIAVLLLFTITSASAATQIGDNITVVNNVTAQNFIGNLNWGYLSGVPADFPNSSVPGLQTNDSYFNGSVFPLSTNFRNDSLLLISTYGTSFPNSSVPALQTNDSYFNGSVFPLSTNFRNDSLLLISTYGTNFPNSSVPALQTNDSYFNGSVFPASTNFNNNSLQISVNNLQTNDSYFNGSVFPASTNFNNNSLQISVNNLQTNDSYFNGSVFPASTNFNNNSLQISVNNLKTNDSYFNGTVYPNSTNFRNDSLLLIATYSGNFPNYSLTNTNYSNNSIMSCGNSCHDAYFVNYSAFQSGVRSNISSSSGLVSYNSTTGVISDSINSSANLYSMNASNITSGNLSVNRLNNGTGASSTTYWQGNGVWNTPTLTAIMNSAAADIPMTNAYQWYNATSLNVTSGTWYLSGQATIGNNQGGGAGSNKGNVTCVMWASSTPRVNISASESYIQATANGVFGYANLYMSGIFTTNSAPMISVSCIGTVGGQVIDSTTDFVTGNATVITALKVG
ncbi:MAG: hypothetical protein O8C56_06650 [Candidatus Methanoperedens sp.]|nr:hypothetical protein [Candidatus Methanoperedens sp.]